MDLRVQFPDPLAYKDWQSWASELNAVLSRMITPTPTDQYPIIILKDLKPAGTAGGLFTAGGWRVRDLNTEYDPVGICLLAGNVFTVPKGRYAVRASAPALGVSQHQTRLWDVTGGQVAIQGTSEYAAATPGQTRSWVVGIIEPKASNAYRLEHFCVATRPTDGYGVATNAGGEVYSQVELWGLT